MNFASAFWVSSRMISTRRQPSHLTWRESKARSEFLLPFLKGGVATWPLRTTSGTPAPARLPGHLGSWRESKVRSDFLLPFLKGGREGFWAGQRGECFLFGERKSLPPPFRKGRSCNVAVVGDERNSSTSAPRRPKCRQKPRQCWGYVLQSYDKWFIPCARS